MSLLQEALKRKEQDESQIKPEAEGAKNSLRVVPAEHAPASAATQQAAEVNNAGSAPNVPPQSMPVAEQTQAGLPAPTQPGRHKTSWLWIVVAGIAIVVGLMLTAGITYLFYHGPAAKAKPVQQAGPINNTVIAGATNRPAGQPVPAPKPEPTGIATTAALQPVAPDANTNNESNGAGAQTQAMAAAQGAEIKPVQPQAERSPATAKPAFFKPKARPAAAAADKWPALKLTGILRGTGKTESTAFINGKLIAAGQTIADVTVVEIQADGVILQYGKEKRFLRVGAVSY